MNDLAE